MRKQIGMERDDDTYFLHVFIYYLVIINKQYPREFTNLHQLC